VGLSGLRACDSWGLRLQLSPLRFCCHATYHSGFPYYPPGPHTQHHAHTYLRTVAGLFSHISPHTPLTAVLERWRLLLGRAAISTRRRTLYTGRYWRAARLSPTPLPPRSAATAHLARSRLHTMPASPPDTTAMQSRRTPPVRGRAFALTHICGDWHPMSNLTRTAPIKAFMDPHLRTGSLTPPPTHRRSLALCILTISNVWRGVATLLPGSASIIVSNTLMRFKQSER